MLAGAMLLSNAGNYILNLYFGRVLTPAAFSDANLMVTFLFTLTSIALVLQLVAARFIARSDELGFPGDSDALAKKLRLIALLSGLLTGAVLAIAAPFWSALFHTASTLPFVILGIGIPFWLVQAVGRGVMQARLAFAPLALSFIVEMITRLGLGVLLVSLGFGVEGATVALTMSFIVTCVLVTLTSLSRNTRTGTGIRGAEVRAYAALVSILLVGQIIANNSDIFIAKAVFTPTDAGIYAAVALVGRAVFFLAWSVATVLFPEAARRQASGRESSGILRGGILAVVGIGLVCTLGALWIGGPVLGVVLGPAYADLSVPLAAYAAVTTLFAIGNLVASYRLSQSHVTESWILLGASLLQLALLLVWNSDMLTLISMQAIAMAVLVIVLGSRAGIRRFRSGHATSDEARALGEVE